MQDARFPAIPTALAQRVRAAGHRSGLRLAIDAFGVHWVTDLASAVGVLRKNYFALFRYRVDFVLLASAAFLALWVAGVPFLHAPFIEIRRWNAILDVPNLRICFIYE